MNLDEIIDKIIKKSGMSKKEIMDQIQTIKDELSGLITDEGAARVLAKKNDIDINYELKKAQKPILNISELNPNKTIVNVVGRVSRVFNVRTFQRKKDKTEGRVGNFILEDKTGQIKIVLWDNQTDYIETHQIKEGMALYIENGTLKTGLNGLEIHIGPKGKMDEPDESLKDRIPELKDIYKINELKEGLRGINVRGVISWKGEIKVFEKEKGQNQVITVFLRDETGSMKCNIWGDTADRLENFNVSDAIRLDDVSVKKNQLGELEIHSSSTTVVNKVKMAIDISKSPGVEYKINELTQDSKKVNITFKVIDIKDTRKVTSKTGTDFNVADVLVADETGCINLNVWNEDIKKIEVGKSYELTNGYVSEFRGSISLNIGKFGELKESSTKIEKVNLDLNKSTMIISSVQNRKLIKDLKQGEPVQIRGAIVNIYEKNPIYESCPTCMKKVSRDKKQWICPKCGEIEDKVDRMLITFVIDDGTENIKVTVAGELAEKFLGLDVEGVKNIIERDLFKEAPLKIKEKELLGKEIIVSGVPKLNDFTENIDIFASNIQEADPLEEAKLILNQIK